MKPCQRRVLPYSGRMQYLSADSYGTIKGVTKLKGVPHPNCVTVLYLKSNLSPVSVVKSDGQGRYAFLGLPTSETYFVVAFDPKKVKNAVIQDNRLAR